MEDFGLGYKSDDIVYVASIPTHLNSDGEIYFDTIKDGLTSYRNFYEHTIPACLKEGYAGEMSQEDIAFALQNMQNGIIKLSINDNSFIKVFSKSEMEELTKKAIEAEKKGERLSIPLYEIGLDNEGKLAKQLEEKDALIEKLQAQLNKLKKGNNTETTPTA